MKRPPQPIGFFHKACKAITADGFAEKSDAAFLLHTASTGLLIPTDRTRAGTIDRIMLSEAAARRDQAPSKDDLYRVFTLALTGDDTDVISVGCSSEADVQVNDESLSRIHAQIGRRKGAYHIVDNGSTTGTQVNGEPVAVNTWRDLESGDTVTLGYVDLIFLQPKEFHRLVTSLFA